MALSREDSAFFLVVRGSWLVAASWPHRRGRPVKAARLDDFPGKLIGKSCIFRSWRPTRSPLQIKNHPLTTNH